MITLTAHISRGASRRTVLAVIALSIAALQISFVTPRPDLDPEQFEGRAPTAQELEPAVAGRLSAAELRRRGHGLARLLQPGERRHAADPALRPGRPADQDVRRRAGPGRDRARLGRQRPRRPPLRPSCRRLAERRLLRAARGSRRLIGFAPFVLRPRRLGEHRVAVVLPTLTWQAYNLRDDNGDGKGDSWYAELVPPHRSARPAVPEPRRAVQLPRATTCRSCTGSPGTGHEVDVLSDADLERTASGAQLAAPTG